MSPVRPWFYTYVIYCNKTGTMYTGATMDLTKRMEQHCSGKVFYTRNKGPVELVYFEACLNKDDAYRRERYLKSGMGKRYIRNRISLNNYNSYSLERGLTG